MPGFGLAIVEKIPSSICYNALNCTQEDKLIKSFRGKTPRIAASAFVSEAAYLIGDIEIGENSSVWPGAVLRADFCAITIGRNSHIEDNCVLHAGFAPLTIGDNVIVGHGVMLHADHVGNNVLIGMNATILNGAVIGDSSVIGACALVSTGMKVPEGSLVMGVPGEVKGRVSAKGLAQQREGSQVYAKLAQEFKAEGF